MRLTAEEHKRGLVSWVPLTPIRVFTRTASGDGNPGEWSDPLVVAEGSKVSSAPEPHRQLRLERLAVDNEQPFPIVWERVDEDGNLRTLVMDPEPNLNQFVALAHIPNYGIYCRIVVAVSTTLGWEADTSLRVGNIILRLHTGSISVDKVASLESVTVDGKGLSVTSDWSGSITLEGRFIEITVPGESISDARLRSTAILGVLALVFGQAVLGEVIASESYEAHPGMPQSGQWDIPYTPKLPATAEKETLDEVDRVLVKMLSSDSLDRAVQLACHWFEKGVRSQTPVDQLISFFVGIETIVNAFSSKFGPVPAVSDRKSKYGRELRSILRGRLDEATRNILFHALTKSSSRERFAFYAAERNIDGTWLAVFGELVNHRNRAFHGAPTHMTDQIAVSARTLLITMLKQELDLGLETPWERAPVISGLTMHYLLAEYGLHLQTK